MNSVKMAAAVMAWASVLVIPAALAQQTYPSKFIRLVNPYAAGGPLDALAREVTRPLSELLGQQFVLDNRPGGGSTVGADLVAKAAPDGYTLLLSGSPSHVILPAMMRVPYHGLKDFTPIAMFATIPNLIVAKQGLPVTSLQSLIDHAKANPGKLSYGSPGNGSIGHLSTELLKKLAGINLVHVPYKGGGPAAVDVLGGHIDLAMLNLSAVLPHIQAGKLRAIAMGTKKRAEQLPDLPTIEEAGFRGYDAGTWYGLFGPAKMPRAIVNTLHSNLVKAMTTPGIKGRLQQQSAEITLMAPDVLAKHLERERDELVPLIKSIGLSSN
jgi:tripartite-type tricarboxylate transporter receptor subunit TctC